MGGLLLLVGDSREVEGMHLVMEGIADGVRDFLSTRRNVKQSLKNQHLCRDALKEYTDNTKIVTEITSKTMAKSLQLEEDRFRHQFGKGAMLQARFNYYSQCQRPDLITGLKPHADGSGYRVILQYEVGLQIFNKDKWHTVP
ncbi:jasmonate-induced oxygenase 2-like [Rhododendron vialii]|uniref:jasmonate-induced oxygenase 2-like n=1 Tax=Rhododendron vialii TaxID=182163 RepID=UPI00265E90F8|nr:jasmonate-induced oxygenase 2-like [Rhododendron vialii]